MKRLDAALVELKLAPSRTKAQRMIEAGEVEVRTGGEWREVRQSSFSLDHAHVRVKENSLILKYVSRGGLKLEAALKHLRLDVAGWRCLDVGLSTGGFADCLFQAGAAQVIGFDVGHDQLAERLKSEPRLTHFSGVNVRELAAHAELMAQITAGIQLCVVDVSFISLQLVLPPLTAALPSPSQLLALVKPQFEVGGAKLEASLFADVQAQILRQVEKCGFSIVDYFPCAVKGQDGNQEFFVYATRT